MHRLRNALALLIAGLVARAAEANVIVVAPSGGNFTQIQPAVNAASDGDTILVRAGGYASFTVNDKALDLVADSGASVLVSGSVRIEQLAAARTVTLTGFAVEATSLSPALVLTNDAGSVRIQGCSIEGFDGADCQPSTMHGGPAAAVDHCVDVSFARCTLNGGDAGDYSGYGYGGDGARALAADTSGIALHDCTLRGGRGASWTNTCPLPHGYGYAGAGAAAMSVVGCPQTVLSGSTLVGGDTGCDVAIPIIACNGIGVGLEVGSQSTVGALGATIQHGVFRTPCVCPSGPTCPGTCVDVRVNGGIYAQVSGVGVRLVAPRVVREQNICRIDVFGTPGAPVELIVSDRTERRILGGTYGVSLVRSRGATTIQQAGTLGANGQLTIAWPIPDLPGGAVSQRFFVQPRSESQSGQPQLGTPATIVLLDSSL